MHANAYCKLLYSGEDIISWEILLPASNLLYLTNKFLGVLGYSWVFAWTVENPTYTTTHRNKTVNGQSN